jgi:hypothetical protein
MERAVTALAQALHRSNLEPTAEDFADWIWLAAACTMAAIDYSAERAQLPQPLNQSTPIPRAEPKSATRPELPRTEATNAERPKAPRSEPTSAEHPEPPWAEPRPAADLRMPGLGTDRASDALPFRTPGGRALPHPLAVVRALRPLVQRVPAPDRPQILDEEPSIRRAVDSGLWLPVFRPRTVPWLELALVIDESPSMIIWNQTIRELQALLAHHGAFRDLRVWRLRTGSNTQEVSFHTPSGSSSRSYKELINPARRCLILVVTDCISPAWQGVTLIQWLKAWGQVHPVTVIQMLPEHFWSLGRLETASPVAVTATGCAIPNARLRALRRVPRWLDDSPDDNFPVPVITLEPDSLADWARFIADGGAREIPAFLFHPRGLSETKRPPVDFARFRANASPTAFKLACFLAAAPLRLPVMQLIRQVLVPEANQTHMAEFLLSGLIKQVVPPKEAAASQMAQPRPDWDQIEYDFIDDNLRRSLLEAGLITDAAQVQEAVSDYIAEHDGGANFFRAVIVDPETAGEIAFPQGSKTFAKVSAAVLSLLGGPYRELAWRLTRPPDRVSDVQYAAQSTMRGVGGELIQKQERGMRASSNKMTEPAVRRPRYAPKITTAAPDTYNLFFSHKRQDYPVTKSIIDLIQRNTDIRCFISGDIEKGTDWREAIANLLTRSSSLVLMLTEPDEDWGWCLYETGFFDALTKVSNDTRTRLFT